MHTRYIFIVISLFMLSHKSLFAMKLIEHTAALKGPRSPDYLNQPLERKEHQRERQVLNGYFTCTDPQALLEKGAQKYQKKEFDTARIFWEHVLHQPHDDQNARALAWYNLGHAYHELDQHDNTAYAWEQAAAQDDDFFTKAEALYNLYVLYRIEKKEEEALAKYKTLKTVLFNTQHQEDDPFHEADALYYLSGVCQIGGELEDAIKYYDMTRLLLERIGWGQTPSDTKTQIQAFKYLIKFAKAEDDEQAIKSYQKNIEYLVNPPKTDDITNDF